MEIGKTKRLLKSAYLYCLRTKFQVKLTFNFFELNLLNRVLPVQKRKGEQHHWILHTQISLDNKFLQKLTILIFWTKFVQKEYFQPKRKRVNSTNEFCIFCIYSISEWKQKKWASPLNSSYSNSSSLTNFISKGIPGQNQKK